MLIRFYEREQMCKWWKAPDTGSLKLFESQDLADIGGFKLRKTSYESHRHVIYIKKLCNLNENYTKYEHKIPVLPILDEVNIVLAHRKVIFMNLNGQQFMMRKILSYAHNTLISLTIEITLPSDEAPPSESANFLLLP